MSNYHRRDLGARLHTMLAEQFITTAQAAIERETPATSFIMPAAPRQNDGDRAQAKRELLRSLYGGGRASDGYNLRRALDPTPQGGTRKIAELPRVCLSPYHNPPSMMVYEAGIWEHVCPVCHARQVFTVSPPTL